MRNTLLSFFIEKMNQQFPGSNVGTSAMAATARPLSNASLLDSEKKTAGSLGLGPNRQVSAMEGQATETHHMIMVDKIEPN